MRKENTLHSKREAENSPLKKQDLEKNRTLKNINQIWTMANLYQDIFKLYQISNEKEEVEC